MSGFPPSKWDVRHLHDLDSLGCTPREDGGLAMEAFIAVRPAGGEEGTFRLVVGGRDKLKLSFAVSRLLPGDNFKGMMVDIELWSGAQIIIEKNSVCSTWWDLEELVSSQDIVITDGKGTDKGEAFLTALQNYKKELLEKTGSSSKAGISIRWILGTRPGNKDVMLIAQVKLSRNNSYNLSYPRTTM